MEGDPEPVFAVRRKDVLHRDPATGAVRRALHPLELGGPPRNVVAGFRGGGARIADREAADVAGGAKVGIHQGCREQLDIGDVVEVGADRVLRQVVGPVHRQRQQIPDGGAVFGPVQPLEGAAAGVGIGGGHLVHLPFERFGDLDERRLFRTAGTGRGHHPEPQLRDHLLGEVGVLGRSAGIEAVEGHVPGLHPVVVAGHAVPPQHLVVPGDGLGGGGPVEHPAESRFTLRSG